MDSYGLQDLRKELKMTRQEFAKLFNLNARSLESWEQGVRAIPEDIDTLLEMLYQQRSVPGYNPKDYEPVTPLQEIINNACTRNRQKKLIGFKALQRAQELHSMGVPYSTIHRQLGLDEHWSAASTRNIIVWDSQEAFRGATRPEWLLDQPVIQTPPVEWVFIGEFPHGAWAKAQNASR